MGVAVIYEMPTGQNLGLWSFNHAAHHIDIVRLSFNILGARLSTFPLDPIRPDDMAAWLRNHQQMHFEMDALLGIQSSDLTGVDFSSPESLTDWIQLHAQEHYQAGQILGVS